MHKLTAKMKKMLIVAVVTAASLGIILTFIVIHFSPIPNDTIDLSNFQARCGEQSKITPGSSLNARMQVDDKVRSYVIHIPSSYDTKKSSSLILAFHGKGGTGSLMERFTNFSASNAIVVYPDGLGGTGRGAWEGAPYAASNDDVHFTAELISLIKDNYCIDASRVFAAGLSNGGGFTSLLSCELSGKIAAFAVVAGAIYKNETSSCPDAPPVPIIAFHGDSDDVIRYQGGTKFKSSYESVDTWLKAQALRNHCKPTPLLEPIGTDVLKSEWTGCMGRGALTQYRIKGGGHTWPGAVSRSGPGTATKTISATDLILDFFNKHPADK